MSRLVSGGLIDRGQPLDFSFDGKAMRGFSGDTLASALVANDVRLVGRSFKYHRPRGILTAGSEEPNALVTLGTGAHAEPNTRATDITLFDGLVAQSQNRWPSLSFDVMAVNQLASPMLVAGFYYKTFMWPAALWEKLYEPLIRRAAGLGALSGLPDPSHYAHDHAFCDLLVIGGGVAGLAAALAAGRAGLRVILADQDSRAGGRLLSERHEIDGMPASDWAAAAVAELTNMANVTVMARTMVFGAYDGCEYGAVQRVGDHRPSAADLPRQTVWKIVAKRAFLATGAIERPLVFGGNDRPGVMMASAVSTYLNRHAAVPGSRGLVFTTTDSGWQAAADLFDRGVTVAAVVDPRKDLPPVAERLRAGGVRIMGGAAVTDVEGRMAKAASVRNAEGRMHRIKADFVAMAGGWNPAIGIGSNMGSRPVWSDAINSFVLADAAPGMNAIGAAAGHFSLGAAMADGVTQGLAVCADLGAAPPAFPVPRSSEDNADGQPLWHVGAHRGKAFVDFQHDVTDSDVALASREGFRSIEHLKRYTTLGMATDQGKTSQLNGHALLAAETGKTIAEAGTILSRPPYLPVAIGALAGHHRDENFRPQRRTASHDWAEQQGAVFVDAGQWKRAQWYARPGETTWLESVNREVLATRGGVGICDVSTLGKIDVHGPDAGKLLDRLYINTFSTLTVGKARYGVMLREDGFVMDDGTTTRLAEDRFFVTTTTVNAARVMQHIDYARQVLWPELDVQATSVTERWATYSVAGPRSRELLQGLLPNMDLSDAAIPYMAARGLRWGGVPARLFRLSFSGELAYEIAVPAHHGDALVRALFAAGAPFGVTPYGTEALGVMRIEKGHAAGNELNGQTTATDLGMGRMMSTKKDYVGRVMGHRAALTDPQRPRLVGLRPLNPADRLRAGGHLLAKGAAAVAANDEGFATSVAYSPSLERWIGLALVRGGPERWGEEMVLHDPVRGPDIAVELCNPVFIDPEGVRVRG